jgi:hypothetical protein
VVEHFTVASLLTERSDQPLANAHGKATAAGLAGPLLEHIAVPQFCMLGTIYDILVRVGGLLLLF